MRLSRPNRVKAILTVRFSFMSSTLNFPPMRIKQLGQYMNQFHIHALSYSVVLFPFIQLFNCSNYSIVMDDFSPPSMSTRACMHEYSKNNFPPSMLRVVCLPLHYLTILESFCPFLAKFSGKRKATDQLTSYSY